MSGAIVDQPAPVANETPAVWALVIAETERRRAPGLPWPALDLLLADMRERDAIGRARYGTPLQAHNGRDALVDAYQEALDCAVYLRQALCEMPDNWIRALYESAVTMALDLRHEIDVRGKKAVRK